MPSSSQVSIPARRSAASTCSASRRLSIAASRWVSHSVRPRAPAASCAQLLAAVVDHRPVGDGDPPARRDRRLLGAGGGDHRLPGGRQQPLARARRARAGRRARSCAAAAIGGRAIVGGERVVDRDRVGLREDHQALAVGDDPAQVRERVLDPRELGRVGGDRVRDAIALDQPHVAPVGGDDQPVGLDQRDRQHHRRATRPGRPSLSSSSVQRTAPSSSQRSSSSDVVESVEVRASAVDQAAGRWRARARACRAWSAAPSASASGGSGRSPRSCRPGDSACPETPSSTIAHEREQQHDDRDRRLDAERREPDRAVQHAAGGGGRDQPGQVSPQ